MKKMELFQKHNTTGKIFVFQNTFTDTINEIVLSFARANK